eukprot:scaffold2720_cov173-Amphora_coffeaeformis.AAC.2
MVMGACADGCVDVSCSTEFFFHLPNSQQQQHVRDSSEAWYLSELPTCDEIIFSHHNENDENTENRSS